MSNTFSLSLKSFVGHLYLKFFIFQVDNFNGEMYQLKYLSFYTKVIANTLVLPIFLILLHKVNAKHGKNGKVFWLVSWFY